ncbi:MAG: glycosyltransferase family 39 protein, partial [bacterium]|nr:glycosyltransferase family 39 protein [bacterium]
MLKNKKNIYRILFAALVLFHLINFIIWIRRHQAYPLWDEGMHQQLILRYLNFFKTGSFNLYHFLSISDYYPPLYHLSCIPLILIIGFGPVPILLTNFLYGLIGLIFLYKTGKLLKDEEQGFWITAIFSFYFFWNFMLRITLIDAALTSFIIISFYLFLKSDNFRDTKCTILFAVFSGLGMLIKWSFLFFLILPLAIMGIKVIIDIYKQLGSYKKVKFLLYILLHKFLFISLISIFFYQWKFLFIPFLFSIIFGYLIYKMNKNNSINYAVMKNVQVFAVIFIAVIFVWYGFYLFKLPLKFTG